MQMNHPLWPVVRESARRTVRIESISIEAPKIFSAKVTHLTNLIGDNIPQRITLPEYKTSIHDEIWIFEQTNEQPRPIVYIGNIEPPIDTCWIEMPIDQGFNALMDSCEQLLIAGYPGCIGCDDSMPEGRWDERKFRFARRKT